MAELSAKDKQALIEWEQLVKDIQAETIIEEDLSPTDRDKKRKELEDDPIEWMNYFFPRTAKYPFAPFQIAFILRIINNMEWYEVLSWARELAKTSIVRMVILYLVLTGRKKNIIIASATEDSAIRLLRPYRAQLTANQRLIYFYGEQKGIIWKEHEFATKKNVIFRAIGYGNEPRGSQFDDTRPDVLLPDDFDTDADCRNEEILNNKWNWWETALYFTRSWSEPLLTIWCGNIIAKDCCITRAGEKARELSARNTPLGNWDIINIRMVDINNPDPKNDYLDGVSVWPAKNSEEQIDIVLAQVSTSSGQKECFNNPVTEGKIFKEMRWGKVPDLHLFRFLIAYGDPAPSNSVTKKSKKASYKAVFLMGIHEGKVYVITGYLDRVLNEEFIDWFFLLDKYVNSKAIVHNLIENNKLQDPFFQQVFKPLLKRLKQAYNKILSIVGDGRDKPQKADRIEGLEPLNRSGELILNIDEKSNPHMQRLEEQFKMFDMQLSFPADGPDCIEGGFWIANIKMSQLGADSMVSGQRSSNSKRI